MRRRPPGGWASGPARLASTLRARLAAPPPHLGPPASPRGPAPQPSTGEAGTPPGPAPRGTAPSGEGGGDSWRSPGAVLGAVAVVISLVALYFSWSAADSARRQADVAQREGDRHPVLEVAAVRALVARGLGGTERSEGEKKRRIGGVSGARVDVSLSNRGSGEALVTSATVLFQRVERLRECAPVAGGPLRVEADYDIPVPGDMEVPATLTRVTAFAVPSGRHARFTLTVGPQTTGSVAPPWIAVVSVTLHEAEGRDVPLPPIALVAPGGYVGYALDGVRWHVAPGLDRRCVKAGAATVAGILRTPGLVKPNELAALGRAMAAYH
ncbi:hypothetical protein [Sphaerisporangium aureirubrum]|uniref:Uncharacterized protein n=1 Tax=Sphaerisporangium aureirubrum TaxID=1544736 RepID=A0ABW1NH62_9ACTN